MAGLDFLQSPALTQFVYPFLLIFFLLFAVIEKTKVLGDRKQINALIAFVIAFIFVAAVFPKQMVGNLMLFLSVGIVIMFVVLLLWGFVAGPDGLKFTDAPTALKWVVGFVIVGATVVAIFWAAGFNPSRFIDMLFNSSWSKSFWTNALFVIMIAAALAVALMGGAAKASK